MQSASNVSKECKCLVITGFFAAFECHGDIYTISQVVELHNCVEWRDAIKVLLDVPSPY